MATSPESDPTDARVRRLNLVTWARWRVLIQDGVISGPGAKKLHDAARRVQN